MHRLRAQAGGVCLLQVPPRVAERNLRPPVGRPPLGLELADALAREGAGLLHGDLREAADDLLNALPATERVAHVHLAHEGLLAGADDGEEVGLAVAQVGLLPRGRGRGGVQGGVSEGLAGGGAGHGAGASGDGCRDGGAAQQVSRGRPSGSGLCPPKSLNHNPKLSEAPLGTASGGNPALNS